MPLPSSPKKPHGWWKLRRRKPEQDPPPLSLPEFADDDLADGERDIPEDQLVFCPSCAIGNILPLAADIHDYHCVSCEAPLALVPEVERKRLLPALFEPLTGIRRRHRARLGFRRALSLFELEVDPNRQLQGDKLREAMQDWLEEQHASWDRIRRRQIFFWEDWKVLAGALTIITLVLVFAVFKLSNTRDEVRGDGDYSISPGTGISDLQAAVPEEFKLAYPTAVAFMRAKTPGELIGLVRDRTRVAPLIHNFYRDQPLEPVEFGEITLVDAANFGGRIFLRLAAAVAGGQFAGLTLEKVGDGYLVDWESFVGFCDVDFATFKAEAPYEGKVVQLRVNASFVEQYLAPYEDKQVFQSILLRSIDGHSLIGYIPRLDPSCIDLRAKMSSVGRNRHEIIVRVRYRLENWTRNEVEIVEIVQTGWVEWDRAPARSADAGRPR